jgi:hypothetical protein
VRFSARTWERRAFLARLGSLLQPARRRLRKSPRLLLLLLLRAVLQERRQRETCLQCGTTRRKGRSLSCQNHPKRPSSESDNDARSDSRTFGRRTSSSSAPLSDTERWCGRRPHRQPTVTAAGISFHSPSHPHPPHSGGLVLWYT